MIQKEQKKGVLMHIDLVKDCIEPLTQPQRGALLETIVAGYYPKLFAESDDEMVRAMAHIIRGNIRNNDERYEKRKQKQAETWAKYNERKKAAAQSAQSSQSPQSLQSSQSLQSLQAPATTTSYTSSTTNTSSDTYTDTYTDTNSDNNQVINKVNNKNNSLSENKYTLDEVKSTLERERIFFKQNWLKEFYLLNNTTYKWKFDPVSAALAFIRLHPEATKGEKKENFPPSSAAPPKGAAGLAYSEMEAEAYRAACELWDAIYKEIRPKIRDEDSKFLLTNLRPDIAWRQGFSIKCLRFIVKNGDGKPTFAELVKTAESILVPQRETFTKYGVKISYRSEKAEGTKKDG
jgi:hypothetical protein